jgi:6-phosphofructokinase 1
MVDTLVKENVSMLFTIGGDGTLRGAKAICDEILFRSLPISVIGVPKTIDNDIPITERTFGFNTAVSRAVEAISSAHCEAFSHRRGVALVKLMGRDSGFIALNATMASGDVNLCLIPECKFDLDTIVDYIENRLRRRSHCLIVVAEGAGQDCFGAGASGEKDKSGNTVFVDVGIELKVILSKIV